MTEVHLPDQVHPHSQPFVRQHAVLLFSGLTFVLTIAVILLPLPVMVAPALVVFIPTLIAVLLITLTDGWHAVRKALFSARAWRIGIKWLLISLAAALALRVFTSLFALALGYPFQPQGFTPFLIVTFLFAAGEEIGWRGYALPLAMKRYSPLGAAVLLGIPWAALHAPLTLPGKMLAGVPVAALLLTMLALSILVNWVYIASGRSLLAPVLLHGGQNLFVFLNNGVPVEPVNWSMTAVYLAAALLVILLTRGRLQARASSAL